MALGLEALIKSFGNPRLDLVRSGPDGIGITPGLHDALMAEPRLAIEGRRLGIRGPVPGVTDSPESRLLIDRIAEADTAIEQVSALLSGSVDGMVIDAPVLLHLLAFAPRLPVASVAALHEPLNLRRRANVEHHLRAEMEAGRLPFARMEFVDLIDQRTYADCCHLPGSVFLRAWLGQLHSRSD